MIALLCLQGIVSTGADQYKTRLAQAQELLQQDHVEQELLLSVANSNADTLKNTLKSLKADYNLTAVERLPTSDEQFRVRFATSLDLAGVIAAQDPNLTVEPNYIMRATGMPTDTYYASEQWYLHNTAQSYHHSSTVSLPGTAGVDINWQPVFDQTSLRGEGTIVAVIDSGLNSNHPDLLTNLWTNPQDPSIDGIDNDSNNLVDDVHGWNFINNTNQFGDDLGHGTLAAGFIGAVDDTHGVVGVAPHTKIMPLKVLDNVGNGSTANVIKAINYAVSHGANVINMSFGGPNASTTPLITACNDAIQAGVVLVAAAGNSNQSIEDNDFAPANINGVIAVGSIDSSGTKASFSNTGNKLSVVAPGQFMLGTRANTSQENTNTVLNDGSVAPDGYIIVSGTSFSAPLVSGAAVLLHQQNANWPPALIQTQLENTARDLGAPGKDTQYGYGLIDLQVALNIPVITPPTNLPPQIISANLSKTSISNDDQDNTILTVTTNDSESDEITVAASATTLGLNTIAFTTLDNHTFTSSPIHTQVVAGNYAIHLVVNDPNHQVEQEINLVITQAPLSVAITTPTSDSHFVTTADQIGLGGTVSGPIQSVEVNSTPVNTFSPGQTNWISNQPLNLGSNIFNVDGYTFGHRLVTSTTLIVIRNLPEPEQTATPTPSPIPTQSATPEPSASPTVSSTPTPEPSNTATSTPTPEPTIIVTSTPTTESASSSSSRTKRRRVSETVSATVNPTADFYDILPNHFAYNQINDLHSKGSIQGINGFYFPNNTVSKGEFLKIALRDAGLVTNSCTQTTSPLPGIETSSLNQELRCAYYYGLLKYENTSFSPNQPISRAQAMVWLISIRQTPTIASNTNYFSDVPVSSWSPSINTAYQHQWIQGFQGLFYPSNTLTRAEAAKVIVNSRS